MIIHGQEGCLKRNVLKNQEVTADYGPWLRASLPARSERSYGKLAVPSDHFGTKTLSQRHERVGRTAHRGGTRRGVSQGDFSRKAARRHDGDSVHGKYARKETRQEMLQSPKPRDSIDSGKERAGLDGSKGKNIENSTYPFQLDEPLAEKVMSETGGFSFGEFNSHRTLEGTNLGTSKKGTDAARKCGAGEYLVTHVLPTELG